MSQKLGPSMAPMQSSGQKEKRSLNLPTEMWSDVDTIAEQTGLAPAEIARQCIELGIVEKKRQIADALGYENKLLINQKLKQRQYDILALLQDLKDQKLSQTASQLLEQLQRRLTD